MKKRVLVVEDDPILSRVLRDNLTFEGFDVHCTANGNTVVRAAKEFAPDLVLLDVNLPGRNGFDVCAGWREDTRPPIIFLTARSQKSDKVQGLKLGADDYVTKPFDLEELMARIHAVLRRARPSASQLVLGNVTIDFVSRKAWKGSAEIELTYRDFELLRYLAERPHAVVYREELLRAVWGYSEAPLTRAVDHAVARLRKKIEADPHKPRFLHTVHGDGYYLAPDPKPAR
jgi:two-component system response regulator VicR